MMDVPAVLLLIMRLLVDVYLPPSAEVKVSVGDKTKGGRTVLAELP